MQAQSPTPLLVHDLKPPRKKNKNSQRQVRLFNVPEDILSRVTQDQGFSSFQSSPQAFPSSVPVGQFSLPPRPPLFPPNMHQGVSFVNYSDFYCKNNPQSVIINSVTRDINDVISEIVTTRPPAPPVERSGGESYICPFSLVPITCPGRGVECNHHQCFDLREFILLQMDDDWRCPVCGTPLTFEQLRFDPFFFKTNQSSQFKVHSSFDIHPPDQWEGITDF